MSALILIAEDELAQAEVLRYNLEKISAWKKYSNPVSYAALAAARDRLAAAGQRADSRRGDGV